MFVLDSGFCVLKALVELKKRGVFTAVLLKKLRYAQTCPWRWDHCSFQQQRGQCSRHFTWTDGWSGCAHHAMKELDYTMMLMTTYRMLVGMGDKRKQHFTLNGANMVKSFHYPEVVYNHINYRDMINNHNSNRMYPISIMKMMSHQTKLFHIN